MSKTTLDRTAWTDDSGGGSDGTIINNAELQAIYDAVDDAIEPVAQVKTGAYTTVVTDDAIICDGTFTVTLFTAVGNSAKALEITNKGTGVITVDPDGTETIGGSTSWRLAPGEAVRIRSDNSNWQVFGAAGRTGVFGDAAWHLRSSLVTMGEG